MPARGGLTKHVIHGMVTLGCRPLNQCLAETHLLDFRGFDAVCRDVVYAISRPDELFDPHSRILEKSSKHGNESAERLNVQPRAARTVFVVLELRRARPVGCNVLFGSSSTFPTSLEYSEVCYAKMTFVVYRVANGIQISQYRKPRSPSYSTALPSCLRSRVRPIAANSFSTVL